jgi:intergrase/recombinase
MSTAKLTDFEKNETNPFVEKAIQDVQISRKYKSTSGTDQRAILQAVDPSSGEVLGHTMFIRQIEVDEEKFTKLYLSQFESFWELPNNAIRVFGYIMFKMKPKGDKFEFRLSECMQYTKYKTKKPVYEGLAALISAEIIARGYNEYVYFINPLVVFNGDRVSYIKTYIKQKRLINSEQLPLID